MNDTFAHMIHDTSFWVMVSTVLCIGFIAFKAFKPIREGLDARATAITTRLAEAEALRLEAMALLDEYKQKSENALHEAEAVLHNADRRAEHLREQLEKELKENIARHEITARLRIERMEEEAINAIKAQIISNTLTQVKDHVSHAQIIAPSIERSMDDIKKTLQQ